MINWTILFGVPVFAARTRTWFYAEPVPAALSSELPRTLTQTTRFSVVALCFDLTMNLFNEAIDELHALEEDVKRLVQT